MDIYSGHMNKLIEQLSRLPGVGDKKRPAPGISHYKYDQKKKLRDWHLP